MKNPVPSADPVNATYANESILSLKLKKLEEFVLNEEGDSNSGCSNRFSAVFEVSQLFLNN